jgi:hypothetical protein
VADDQWDLSGSARRALQGIVADSHYGVAALSQPGVISNLLKDLLPDEPRESSLLVAAAQADLAGNLRGYLAQGMDMGTAVRLTASRFVATTPHSQEAGAWVVNELALAIGLDTTRPARQETVTSPLAPQPLPAPAFDGGHGQAGYGAPAQPGLAQPGLAQPGLAQPGAAQPRWAPPPRTPAAGQRPGPLTGAGIAGLAGVLFIVLGSLVPFIKYPDQPAESIFGGYKGEPAGLLFWNAIEPAAVAVVCLVLAIILLTSARPTLLVCGMLTGFGIESTLLFAGYAFAIDSPGKRGAGGALGLLGALAILAAGLISYRYQRSQPEAGPPTAGQPVAPAPPGFSPRPQ